MSLYRKTIYRQDGKTVYAKDGCKRCHGTGSVGTFKPVTGQSGKTNVLLCRCCQTKKDEEVVNEFR